MTDPVHKTSNDLLDLIKYFKEYIRARNNATAWYHDPYAYDIMKYVERVEKDAHETGPNSKAAISADLEKVQTENDLLSWRAERAIDLLEDAPGAAREALRGEYDHEFPSSEKASAHAPGCWKLQSPSGQGVCNCGAE